MVELAALVPQWSVLAERALEPNVFYEPAFALAAAPVFGRDAGAGLVWSRTTPPRLLGLFPARVERRRYGVPLPVLVGWTHPYGPLGTPLVDREAGEAVIAAWLDHLSTHPQLPNRMLLPFMPAEGPVGRAFDSTLARRGGSSVRSHPPPGPAGAGQDHTGYVEHAVGRKSSRSCAGSSGGSASPP